MGWIVHVMLASEIGPTLEVTKCLNTSLESKKSLGIMQNMGPGQRILSRQNHVMNLWAGRC